MITSYVMSRDSFDRLRSCYHLMHAAISLLSQFVQQVAVLMQLSKRSSILSRELAFSALRELQSSS